MLLRRKNIQRLMKRSWNRITLGSVILRQYSAAADEGFLNVAKDITYIPVKVKNCGINLNPTKEDTYAGIRSDCEAIVYLPLYNIEDIEVTDKDLINIGGSLADGIITGGYDYTISDIGKPDSGFEEEFLLKLELKRK